METTLWKGQKVPVHRKEADHRWMRLRAGHPQMICKCGEMRVRRVRSGNDSIVVGSLGGVDIINFTVGSAASVLGDLSMNVSDGRPNAFIEDISTALVGQYEILGQRKLAMVRNRPGVTTLDTFGLGNVTQNQNAGIAVSDVLSDGEYVSYTTTTGQDAGNVSVNTVTRTDFIPSLTALMRTGASVASVRYWVGLFGASPMGSDTPPNNSFGFRFSTGAGDVNWKAVTADGVSNTIADTGVAVVANTTYYLSVIRDNSNSRVIFVISRVGSGRTMTTITTTVPTAAVNQEFDVQLRPTGAVNNNILISHIILGQLPGFVR